MRDILSFLADKANDRIAAMLAIIPLAIFALLSLLAINFLLNWWSIRVIEPDINSSVSIAENLPLVSILVPARNEAANIVNCLESLLAQDYPAIEIIVLDDQSEDDTGNLIAAIAARDARVKMIKGTPLPTGWIGKCWACHQLWQSARGEWLLFTDADTRFQPQAISASLRYADQTNADLLSILPKQLADDRNVKLMIPLLYFTLYTMLPGALMQRAADPSISAAIGQFLLFRRAAYQQVGGHQALANSIVEDLDFARAIKLAKLRVVLADGNGMLSCRMYNSLAELWSGFTKNFFASFSYSAWRLSAFMIFTAALYLLPWLLLALNLAGIITVSGSLIASEILLPYLLRALLAQRHSSNLLALALHPLAVTIMLIISGNSLYRIASGRGVDWKGRMYKRS